MNWDAIGAIGEILGAIAVVLSLLYLAVQIRQSNRVATRESTSSLQALFIEFNKLPIENPEHASLRVKLQNVNPDLTPEEEEQAFAFAAALCNLWGSVTSSFDAGLLPGGSIDLHLNIVSYSIRRWPGLSKYLRDFLDESAISPESGPLFAKALEEIEEIESASET